MIELEDHIALLHEYNDIKDVAQMLLGKLGEYEGVGRWLLPSQGSPNLLAIPFLSATLLLQYTNPSCHQPPLPGTQ